MALGTAGHPARLRAMAITSLVREGGPMHPHQAKLDLPEAERGPWIWENS